MTRNPSTNPTPLDWASFYVESLKFGPKHGHLQGVSKSEAANTLEALLRDANVTSMTGAELDEAMNYYAESYARQVGLPIILIKSLLMDGLMHGVALTAGLKGELRNPPGR